MALLKLGVQALPAPEAGLIRALVALIANGQRADFRWAYSEAGPFDALVTDAATDGSSLVPARAVLRLAGTGALPGPDTLARPLRAEQLESWLAQVTRRLERGTAPAGAAAIIPPKGQPRTGAGPRYKLRRWPPHELLRADTGRVRLATLLSARALSVVELASLSQSPQERCHTFVQLLQGFDLLETAEAPVARAHISPSPATAGAEAPGRWNLVRSIRRRLGLGQAAS